MLRAAWAKEGLPVMRCNSYRAYVLLLVLIFGACSASSLQAGIVDFDDLSLAPNSSWSGPAANAQEVAGTYGPVLQGTFSSGGVDFVNRFNEAYGSWSGFAYSNQGDQVTEGYFNQFSAIAGSGFGPGSDNFAVGFGYDDVVATFFDDMPFNPMDVADLINLPHLTLAAGTSVLGAHFTNTTYAALSMLNGDGFAKKFGGASGTEEDWFKLSIYGTDTNGDPLLSHVDFYLADYRFATSAQDYVVKDWQYVDLSALAGAEKLYFNLSSSDVGIYGMNTPAYFAMDQLVLESDLPPTNATPEPATLAIWGGIGVLGWAWGTRKKQTAV